MRYALIPTKKAPPLGDGYEIEKYLTAAGWNVIYLENKKSIFDAYNEIIKTTVKPEDYVIMCHDDISILTDKKVFNDLLNTYLDDEEVGFVGVAGTQFLPVNAVWWNDASKYNPNSGPMNPLKGMVYHGNSIYEMTPSFYGHHGQCVVLDGLFLAAKGETLLNIYLGKPEVFEGDWDFYDIYYTIQTHLGGKKNMCMPITVLHKSIGQMKEGWYKNREAFIKMYRGALPIVIK